MSSLGDLAEKSGIERGVEQIAAVRASSLMKQFASIAENCQWHTGAAEKFMKEDKAQFVMDTNQGRFVLTITRG